MNRRNHDYIMKYNPRRYYPMVDDKLLTKTLAAKAGVPVATLIGAIRYQYEVKNVENMIRSCPGGFVIKPGHGSGGRGILVVHRHSEGRFEKNDGTVLDRIQVYRVITDILSGLYSLGGQVDYALLEECIDFSDVFRDYSFQGIPDVRVIVFRGYPVMAMIRLATKQSDGRANFNSRRHSADGGSVQSADFPSSGYRSGPLRVACPFLERASGAGRPLCRYD